MAVEVLISNEKYFNQLSNGADFGSNLSDYTPNLAGCIGERIRCSFDVDIKWSFILTSTNNVEITDNGTTLTRTTGSWKKDGFSINDNISVSGYQSLGTGPILQYTATATIISISDLVIRLTILTGDLFFVGTVRTMEVYGISDLTALIFKFGLIANDENYSIISKVSNHDQAYYIGGINHTTPTYIDFIKLGNNKDWITCEPSNTNDFNQSVKWLSTTDGWQKFNIITDILLNPFYIEQWKQNVIDETIPDFLAGLNSLKFVFEAEFFTTLSNPNTSKKARVDNNLGSVGYLDENFNGFEKNYSINSVVFTESSTGNTATALIKGSKTKATIAVEKIIGTFNSGENFGVSVNYCPPSIAYENTVLTNMEENFLFDNAINSEAVASTAGVNGIIKTCEATIVGSYLVIEVEIEYTSAQQLLIENDGTYQLKVLIADKTILAGNSDRINLTADYNEFTLSADIPDLFSCSKFELCPFDKTIGVDVLTTDLVAYVEDDVAIDFEFWLDTSKLAVLNSLKFVVIAYNSILNKYFIVDSFVFNIANAVVANGIQQLSFLTDRGYFCASTDLFNKVEITTDSLVSTKQYYSGQIAQKISWQTWIKQVGNDSVFYDSTKPLNNLNKKLSNYSELNDYSIHIGFKANVAGINTLGQSGNTDYLVISPKLIIRDYLTPTDITPTIRTYTTAGVLLDNASILPDADTLMKVTWDATTDFIDITNFYAVHRIEETGQAGYAIDEFSTIVARNNSTKGIFKGVTGYNTIVKKEILTGNVVTSCLIDYTKLTQGVSYNLSARFDDGEGSYDEGKMTEEGEYKYTEEGELKILDK